MASSSPVRDGILADELLLRLRELGGDDKASFDAIMGRLEQRRPTKPSGQHLESEQPIAAHQAQHDWLNKSEQLRRRYSREIARLRVGYASAGAGNSSAGETRWDLAPLTPDARAGAPVPQNSRAGARPASGYGSTGVITGAAKGADSARHVLRTAGVDAGFADRWDPATKTLDLSNFGL